MDDSLQCKSTPKGPRTPSSATRHLSRSSLQTPENSSSWLQHLHDTDSAHKDHFRIRYERSPSERTLKGYITLSIDPSCYGGVEANEENVRLRIMDDFKSKASDPATAKEGYVYAFRDNDFALVKIGFAADWAKRKGHLERNCGFVTGLTFLAAVKVKAHRRLEEIVHQDPAPHRRFFDSACGKNNKGFTRHQEYFQIDDAAALSTLQLWADFVEEQPYEQDPSTGRTTGLREEWSDRLAMPAKTEPDETHGDHNKRIERWRTLLDIPDPKVVVAVADPPLTAGISVEEHRTVITTEKLFPLDGTPSKPPRPSVSGEAVDDGPVKPFPSSLAPLQRSSSNKVESFVHVQDQKSHSTSRLFEFGQPSQFSFDKSTDRGTAIVEKTSTQTSGVPDPQSVDSATTKPTSIFASMAKTQPDKSDLPRVFAYSKLPATTDKLCSAKQPVNPVALDPSMIPGCFANIKFDADFPSSNHNLSASSTQTSSTIKTEQSTAEELKSAISFHPEGSQREHKDEHPGSENNLDKLQALWGAQSKQTGTSAILTRPLAQLIFELASNLLAKEIRPLPVRTTSTDLWQLRWPLACSVVSALQSPHVPSVLSFLMWSVFLPFFVAELRGWTCAAL